MTNRDETLLNDTTEDINMKTLYLLRGVSGCGKTTLAKTLEVLLPNCITCAADDYHYDGNGNYNWKPENLKTAHTLCQGKVDYAMFLSVKNIIVHNTNTTQKETQPYLDMAEKYGYRVVSLVVENLHGNKDVHNVPQDIRNAQEKRLRDNIKLQ